tara:strand:+ start:8274 stop:8645 length:372 start_codon:yes stop_codon:yes gene_type:complete
MSYQDEHIQKTIRGKVLRISETYQVGKAKNIDKRDLIIEEDEFGQKIHVVASFQNTRLLRKIEKGQELVVTFFITCNAWGDKFFTNLEYASHENVAEATVSRPTINDTSTARPDIEEDNEPPF